VTGKLLGNLQALGLQPSDIDTVVITHAHPDHVGGTLDEAGGLVFPDAHYFIAKAEWDFWSSDAAATRAPASMVNIARHNLAPLHDRLTMIADGGEIVPGIQAIATPGHTPGHIALSIASDGQQLLHISDVVLYPLHLEYPEWVPVFDIAPEQAANSKQRIFDRAAAEQALVFGHHFPPFPNLGYVHKLETGWQWQPLRR
jgi:glyoxylase-like metal-dependent hydrolase (beta-lactamase superfamily II)